jgi:glycosyltransferase involved in cell wall biosynthesis
MAHDDVGIFFGRPDRSDALAHELRRRGVSVTFYNTAGPPGAYVPVPAAFGPALRTVLATDHRVYLTSFTFTPGLCLYLNRVLRHRPYVFNVVGDTTAMYRDRARRWPCPAVAERGIFPLVLERTLAGATRIVCNSRYLERTLRSRHPRHAAKMSTIYNGVDFDRFTAEPRARGSATSSTLLSVMTWDYAAKARGAQLLIDALDRAQARHPRVRLVIAAKAAHRRYADAIETFLATKRCRDAVTIHYNHPRVEDLLAAADVFVYATPADSNDSLPRALLEAHAAGLPIVTTATAGCPEAVVDGVTGFTVPYDAEPLAQRVLDLLRDADMRAAFGRQGRLHVERVFRWEHMGDAYARLLLEVASSAARAAEIPPTPVR